MKNFSMRSLGFNPVTQINEWEISRDGVVIATRIGYAEGLKTVGQQIDDLDAYEEITTEGRATWQSSGRLAKEMIAR